ncbi:MAG: type II toxin-antitoxin system VapC family toxin [Balneolales bacterium]
MEKLVIDAGVALKWFLNEEFSEQARSIMKQDYEFHVPDLFFLETSAVLSKKARRRELYINEATRIRNILALFPFDVTPDEYLKDQAFDLSLKFKVSMYDCMYIMLAMAVEGKMITADRRFYRSMQQFGLAEWVALVQGE